MHYGGVHAVDGVTIEAQQGLLYGLIGPNGSGKSTLLAAMTRLTPLTRGKLLINGIQYDKAHPSQMSGLGVARTFQTVRLISELSVIENVMLGADATKFHGGFFRSWLALWETRRFERESRLAAELAIDRVGLKEVQHSNVEHLPYGLQRLVEIARALASEPTFLFLDEPTAGMSHEERERIVELLIALRSEGLTQIVVEHHVPLITRLCDKVFAMQNGIVVAEGDAASVVRSAEVQEAYLGKQANVTPRDDSSAHAPKPSGPGASMR